MMVKVVFCALGILLYLFIAAIYLYAARESFHFNGTDLASRTRDATPKDAWLSLMWPFLLAFVLIRGFIGLMHTAAAYALLLIGIPYVNSERYKIIDKKLWS